MKQDMMSAIIAVVIGQPLLKTPFSLECFHEVLTGYKYGQPQHLVSITEAND